MDPEGLKNRDKRREMSTMLQRARAKRKRMHANLKPNDKPERRSPEIGGMVTGLPGFLLAGQGNGFTGMVMVMVFCLSVSPAWLSVCME